MSQEARREKQDTLERKVRDLRRMADDFQKELEKKEQGIIQQAGQEIFGIIERIGKQRGYAIILDRRAGVIYGASEADVTEEIIKAYDQETANKRKK